MISPSEDPFSAASLPPLAIDVYTAAYRVSGTTRTRFQRVADVHAFPGHIACDPKSKSEIVVPVFAPDHELIAVLDVDSDRLSAFDGEDRAGLERLVALFQES